MILNYLRRIIPLEHKQWLKDLLRGSRERPPVVTSEAQEAILLDAATGVEWARRRIAIQDAEIRALRDDLEEVRAKLKEYEDQPITMANLQNWIDVLKDGNENLLRVVYDMKGQVDAKRD